MHRTAICKNNTGKENFISPLPPILLPIYFSLTGAKLIVEVPLMWDIFRFIADPGSNLLSAVDYYSLFAGAVAGSGLLYAITRYRFRKAAEQDVEQTHKIMVQNRLMTILEAEIAEKNRVIESLHANSLTHVMVRADELAAENDFLAELRGLLKWWDGNRAALATFAGKLGDKYTGFGHQSSVALRQALGLFQIAYAANPSDSDWRDSVTALTEAVPEESPADEVPFDIYGAELHASNPETIDTMFDSLETDVERLIAIGEPLIALKTATRAGRLVELGVGKDIEIKRARAMVLWSKAAMAGGKLHDALVIAEEAWELRKFLFSAEHADTLAAALLVAQVRVKLEQHEQALAIAQEVWESRKRELSEEHADTLASAALVARIMVSLKQDEQALPVARAALEAMKRVLPKGAPGMFQLAKLVADIEKRLDPERSKPKERTRSRRGERARTPKVVTA